MSPTAAGAVAGGAVGGPPGAIAGAVVGTIAGAVIGQAIWDNWFANEGEGEQCDIGDFKNNPPNHPDYKPPKNWDGNKVKNPNGPGSGYPDKKGNVWVPTDHKGTHAPHHDVQNPKTGGHVPVYP